MTGLPVFLRLSIQSYLHVSVKLILYLEETII
ncbi:hypothetical protein BZL35_00681 [Candidatus Pandoraea novymonadis]|uniref:Uncharacterized protein n=1 Tax=Candidatus Pandoraea novymonadis TaxID=1808959 RepID=A0ABX5FFE2_9BURK|nr:hypothetical protein BZL35_00681 [Candidatus Pandoraea novymonadis]